MQSKTKTAAASLPRVPMRAALVALAIGCTAAPGFALAGTTTSTFASDTTQAARKADKQVLLAERAVAKAPQSAEARARLGQTYLSAGRFASAGTSFEDAVALGDQTPATALGMALAYIGAGRNAEATTLLAQWRDSMPTGDFALALALAGQPKEATEILSASIRGGENTPKLRQNLAYAFALAGQLREARVVAAQDVPFDQLEVRISDWALQASVGSQQSRVAALLGAPVRSDPGRPAQLALATVPAGAAQPTMLAMNEAPVAEPATELPPLASPALAQADAQAAPEPVSQPMLAVAEPAPEPVLAAAEPVAEPAPAPLLASADPLPRAGLQFVSNPVVQDISAYTERRMARAEASAPPRAVRRAPARSAVAAASPVSAPVSASATHLVQLGSFTTEAGARRAWDIFVSRDPSLKERELRITEALVNGRRYFRVAAAGFDARAARDMCSSVRGRGRDCMAFADRRGQPGVLPTRSGGERLARS